ncbi:OsmC family protein [Alicyclobacillus pomorum]|jgi:putative redox protein|uniref:OsmC family protein n=1 Tax=Alicyclobacillus pomorum TaxID=204470 RepID=UPI0003F62399|nr:OsmC family protein [Alicyclobacillus pomorum]
MEMSISAQWQGKRQFVARGASGHQVTMDAKPEVGGEDKGSRPMEMLLMGLAGCTGIDVTMILEKMRQQLERFSIEVVGKRREEYPQAFTEIHLTYRMDGDVDADKAWRAIVLSEEKYCSASASLNATIIPHLVLNGTEIPSPTNNSGADV